MSKHKKKSRFTFLMFLCFCFLAVLILFELGLRFLSEPHSDPPLHRLRTETPYLFDLNPEHDEINALGFRKTSDKLIDLDSKKTIAILGDSVVYGLFVPKEKSFPSLLQSNLLRDQSIGDIRVINGGVNGYTPYNTRHFYLDRIKPLNPDVVFFTLCLNDIVNPVMHWDEPRLLKDTPLEAYPRGVEGEQEAKRWVAKQKGWIYKLLSHSAIFRLLDHVVMLYQNKSFHNLTINGKKWPVHLADESRQSIETYKDLESVEWKWLKQNILWTKKEVEETGAKFVLLFLPLAYELDPQYPIELGSVYQNFCAENKMMCLDPLDDLKKLNKNDLYMNQHRHHLRDIWHFSARGHAVIAQSLLEFLKEKKILETEN